MDGKYKAQRYLLTILTWGALWGIFEATVGYVLHTLSFGYSWLIWYPAACFFMTNVYRRTGQISSVLLTGLLCAGIKLLNLLLLGRIDRVLNPAVSIVFEALAMAAVVYAVNRLLRGKARNPVVKGIAALAMNTGWRLLYILYLLVLVPAWIREVSVISSTEKFLPFFVTQNLLTSGLIYIGYLLKERILKPVATLETWLSKRLPAARGWVLRTGLAVVMLGLNITLQMILQ